MKQKLHTLALILFAAMQLAAQPIIKNQAVFGGLASEVNPCMAFVKKGGVIMAVQSNSNASGNKTENNRDTTGATPDYWVVKLSAMGQIEWDKTLGGTGSETPHSIIATKDGGYAVAGYSNSGLSGDKTEASKGGGDIWIVKLDSLGNKIWDKTYGGSDDEYHGSIQETSNGFIVGCLSYSGKTGDKTDISRGLADCWLLKLDKNGNKIWDKTYGGSQGDGILSLDITASGNYILGGTSTSGASGEKTEPSRGGQDYWVITVDRNGNKLWDKTFGTTDEYENFQVLQTTRDGGFILGGFSNAPSGGDKTENGRGGYDYWVIKLDSSGNKLWDKTFGGSDNDQLYALQQTKDKGYVFAGASYSDTSGDKTEPRRNLYGDMDYWVVKTDSLGQIGWDKTIGGSRSDHASAIIQFTGSDYLVAGNSTSGKSGDRTIRRQSIYFDTWVVRLQVQPEGLATTENMELLKTGAGKFTVYPNPATDVLHIQSTGKNNFILTNQSGKTVLSKTITSNGDIDVSKLQPGVYFLVNKTINQSQKVIINK